MVDLMVGFRRNFDIWPTLQRGMPVCQVKKKFKDLQVGDILLVTKDGWGIHVFFLNTRWCSARLRRGMQVMPRTPFGLQSCVRFDNNLIAFQCWNPFPHLSLYLYMYTIYVYVLVTQSRWLRILSCAIYVKKKWGIDGSTPFKTGQLSHLCP